MNKVIRIIGLTMLIVSYIVILETFMTAFFNPTKSVTIFINNYNEATVEFILFILTLPFVLLYIYESE